MNPFPEKAENGISDIVLEYESALEGARDGWVK
jgi:hypothetical protein